MSDGVVEIQNLRETHLAGCVSMVLYATVSISMNFLNKITLQSYGFNSPVTLLFLQQVLSVCCSLPFSDFGCRAFFSPSRLTDIFPVSVLYAVNVGFSLAGVENLNIPMFSALKRLTAGIVLVYNFVLYRERPPLSVIFAVFLTVLGAIVAGLGDTSFDWSGCCFALLSCCFQGAYLVLVQRTHPLDTVDLMVITNGITVFPIGFWLYTSGEFHRSIDLAQKITAVSSIFWPVLFFTASLGVMLNFTLFWCSKTNSALTTTLVGIVKSAVTTFLGYFLLGGVPFSFINLIGVIMNVCGGCWYSLLQYRAKRTDVKKLP
eukprot:Rmarinus@m.18017